MADRNTPTHHHPPHRPAARTNHPSSIINAIMGKLHAHSPNSSQLVGFLTLFISGSILLFLTGITVTVSILGLIFFAPLLIVSSPIWLPIGTVVFLSVAAFLSVFGFGVAAVAGTSWIYRYFRGMHPPGSDRVDYARSRIYDTASHVKDYAREYGGYLQNKVKDAAPGA